MIKIKNFIAQITVKRNLKWVLVFLVLGGLFVGKTYAVDGEMSSLDTISWFLHLLLSVASWAWILLANLAGKLMTNDMVYGSFLHLDSSLWTLWNIMKNFANFALGFLVLFAIVKSIISGPFGKEDTNWSPLSVIKKTLIAGVLIQMSWFFMGAVIDLSTIMTSAIGAFPSQFIASNSEFRGNMNNNLKDLKKGKITFNPDNPEELVKWEPDENHSFDDDELNKLIDTIMPSYDSVSGPLIFLGLSVFKFNDFDKYTDLSSSSAGVSDWGDMFLSLGMDAIILIFFSLMMFFIFLFNLFRIIMLWIIIPLTPIIVLLKVFGLTEKLKGGSSGMDLGKFLDIKTILTLVFKPVLMVGTLSLILVILVLIQNVIAPNKVGTVQLGDQSNVIIETVEDGENTYKSTMKAEGIMEFSMSGVKDTIADLIVYFFGLFLIYFLVRMVVKTDTGIGFIDKSMTGLMDTFEGIAKNLPVIPIGSGGAGISAISSAGDKIGGMATRMAGIDVAGQNLRIMDRLGLGNSIDSLNTSMGRDDFISSAHSIVSSSSSLKWNDASLLDKMDAWNVKNAPNGGANSISRKQIEDNITSESNKKSSSTDTESSDKKLGGG